MSISPISVAAANVAPGPSQDPAGNAKTPDEAAKQFESVLVRQFVEVMTRSLFESDEEGMMTGQSDLRKDILTDTLTDQLVDSGSFGISELLMRQWNRKTTDAADLGTNTDSAAPSPAQPTSTSSTGTPAPDRRLTPRFTPPAAVASAQAATSAYSRPSMPAESEANRPDHYRGSVNSLEHALRMFQPAQAPQSAIDNAPDTP